MTDKDKAQQHAMLYRTFCELSRARTLAEIYAGGAGKADPAYYEILDKLHVLVDGVRQ